MRQQSLNAVGGASRAWHADGDVARLLHRRRHLCCHQITSIVKHHQWQRIKHYPQTYLSTTFYGRLKNGKGADAQLLVKHSVVAQGGRGRGRGETLSVSYLMYCLRGRRKYLHLRKEGRKSRKEEKRAWQRRRLGAYVATSSHGMLKGTLYGVAALM